MCDLPEPCECTLTKRVALRTEHIARHEALSHLAFRLSKTAVITDAERDLLYRQAEEEWDDAIHIATPGDPLRSLCGMLGRNLVDLPECPDTWAGCWGCLDRAAKLMKPEAAEVELAHA
jgi:hypothetical protein